MFKDHIRNYVCDGTPEAVIDRYALLPDKAKQNDYGEFDRNVVVLDTETTGFSLNHDELTQIAAARLEKGEIVEWFVTFVNPGKSIPDDVAHLTNIHDEDVADAPSPEEALSALVSFVGDAKIVAHNAEFDRNFTTKHPAGYPLLGNTWLDSLDLARVSLPKMKSHRLIDLVKAFGAPLSTHRADEDVAATCALYRILLAAVSSMPDVLLREIAQMEDPANWPTVVVFKHFAEGYSKRRADDAVPFDENSEKNVSRETFETVIFAAQSSEFAVSTTENVSRETSTSALFGGEPDDVSPTEQIGQMELFSKRRPFSIRRLRSERIRNVEMRAKRDANTLDGGDEPFESVSYFGSGQVRVTVKNPANEAALRPSLIESDSWDKETEGGLSQSLEFPEREEISQAFSADGLVGRRFESYEARNEQVEMALAVARSLREKRNLAVEAGTGVGKSMAYLVPLVLTATKNNINVGVATKTNALLDQLVYQELPRLRESLSEEGIDLTYTALKGFSHYPCLRRIERIVNEGPKRRLVASKECSQAPALAALLSFIEQTEYDDLDSLKIDYRTLPKKIITTSSHECLRRKCPFYGTACFVHGSRRKAEASHVVVTNHSLLFCDLAAGNGLLPPIRYWAVDEAHGAENEARRAFSMEMTAEEIRYLAQKVSSEETARNVFTRAERTVTISGGESAATLFYALTNRAKAAGSSFADAAAEFCDHMRDLLVFDPSKRSKGYEIAELWINGEVRASSAFASLIGYGKTMVSHAEKLASACQELVAYLDDQERAAAIQREIAVVAMDLKELIRAAETILFNPSDNYVYATTLSKRGDKPVDKLEAMPFNVGDTLNETLYANTKSVVYASATLAVGDSFASFEDAMGLNTGENSRADALALASSYDFDRQMTVYVANDIPEPNDPRYLAELQAFLAEAHIAQGGAMLTLFTNRKEMEKCFDEVNPALKEQGLRLVCQKWGVSVKGLRDDFLADEHLSLFALKSFWEGFDAPGATLKAVIIPKLPFAKPTDPLSCERSARDDYAWRRYVLPAAILETKQAAGRLIRRADDRGVLILADRRLLTKSYGKSFIRSLPSKNVQILPMREIVERIRGEFA